jgi:hypothetical protein
MQNVWTSLDGNMDKEGGRWHQVPHVIQQIYVSVPCEAANSIINYFTKLTPQKEASWINDLYKFLKLLYFPFSLV